MSDYKSGLPIRSEKDGLDERLHSKLVDYTDPDGADNQLEISEKLAHVRSHGKDAGGTKRELLLSEEGMSNSNGDYDAATNTRPSSSASVVHDRAASPGEAEQNVRSTGIASTDGDLAHSQDMAIRDSQGNKIDENNPLATYQAESPADEVDDFDKAVDVAKDATENHDYTVTALKDFKSIEAFVSASGRSSASLEIETAVASGIFTQVAEGYITTSNPNLTLSYKKKVAAGIIVRVAKTNYDNQPFDINSQIKGLEI